MNAGGVSATVTLLLAAEPQVADRDELAIIVRRRGGAVLARLGERGVFPTHA